MKKLKKQQRRIKRLKRLNITTFVLVIFQFILQIIIHPHQFKYVAYLLISIFCYLALYYQVKSLVKLFKDNDYYDKHLVNWKVMFLIVLVLVFIVLDFRALDFLLG
ncbi:hypothetical protein [Ligilactobacillus ceti]|uniref:Uncharacterized protein n=1 Tax=Ligilactobacillus ceti DSM 22408 TaxID=1122146 RepID=A0A0R2KRK5_9LACO|nr:hypothetical protein [Ligilactobacillus ceti]KRN88813.1 hypothetical protein IV53_GL000783 [Ligilactobacillus ceti DSM 22408]